MVNEELGFARSGFFLVRKPHCKGKHRGASLRYAIPMDTGHPYRYNDPTKSEGLVSMYYMETMADLNEFAKEIGFRSASDLVRKYKVPAERMLHYWIESTTKWHFNPSTAKTQVVGEENILFVTPSGRLFISRGDAVTTFLLNPRNHRQAYMEYEFYDWIRP